MATVHVKICGITNLDDARVAVEAGADLLGFILYPQSPRYVAPEVIREIVTEIREWRLAQRTTPQSLASSLHSARPLRPHFTQFVGVFVHEPASRVRELVAQSALDYAQLHSDETPEALTALAGFAFKALRPTNAAEALADAARFAPLGPAHGPSLLIDAHDPAAYGGTGKTADWHAAAAVARQHPGLLLAGGLTAANVAQAIQTVQPWGVDVSSGVETAPGQKDHAKVRAFVAAAKVLVNAEL